MGRNLVELHRSSQDTKCCILGLYLPQSTRIFCRAVLNVSNGFDDADEAVRRGAAALEVCGRTLHQRISRHRIIVQLWPVAPTSSRRTDKAASRSWFSITDRAASSAGALRRLSLCGLWPRDPRQDSKKIAKGRYRRLSLSYARELVGIH